MRLSTLSSDPGYAAWKANPNVSVWLDGRRLTNCLTVDTVEGTVLCDRGPHIEYRGRIEIRNAEGGVIAQSLGQTPPAYIGEST